MALSMLLASLGLGALQGAPSTEPTPSNLLVIVADDLSARNLGSYIDRPSAWTPNLDRLAREGVRFEACWSTPLCTPSRVQLLTGRYGTSTGFLGMLDGPFAPGPTSARRDLAEQDLFPQRLQAAGYATALAGKWQLPGELPELVRECGFDTYRVWAYADYLPEGYEHPGRFEPRGVPARYWHPALLEDGAPLPTGPGDYGPDRFVEFLEAFVAAHAEGPFLAYYPMCLVHRPWEDPPLEEGDEEIPSGFVRNLVALDRRVGKLVDALDRLELREETLVVFTADNPRAGTGKGRLSPEGVHVPLILSQPGRVPQGSTRSTPVDLADLYPTLIEAAGLELAGEEVEELDGRSLWSLIADPGAPHRRVVASFLEDGFLLRHAGWVVDREGSFWALSEDQRRLKPAAAVPSPVRAVLEQARALHLERLGEGLAHGTETRSGSEAEVEAEAEED